MPPTRSVHVAAPPAHSILEQATWSVLRRIGLALTPEDNDFVHDLIPFVIDPEFLHRIPPLESLPSRNSVCMPVDGIRYQNVALDPVPVLSSVLAALLVAQENDVDVQFVDGQNVYGANVFERHEGRRLLRRAIGFLHDEMAADGTAFDIIAFESDGFLIARRRVPGAAPLEDKVRRIIARMTGAEVQAEEWPAIRDRLATFFVRAHGTVLAPAAVCQESKHDLELLLTQREIEARGTLEERRARLQGRSEGLSSLLEAIARRPVHDQEIVIALVEYRMYDPVLQTVTERLDERTCRVTAFRAPGELLARVRHRSIVCFHVEVMSLLKSINEHPLGGYLAGNEALRAIYVLLATTLQRVLRTSGVEHEYDIYTLRRWGDFYVALDRDVVDACDIRGAIEDAFAMARYIVIEKRETNAETPYAATLLATAPAAAPSRIVVPLIPVVSRDAELSDDLLSMPIEQPGHHKRSAIDKRLYSTTVPDLDVAFLADWTLNACDPNRGIPRLVDLLQASDDDVQELSQHYERYVNRRGKTQSRIRREDRVIRSFRIRLKQLIVQASGSAS